MKTPTYLRLSLLTPYLFWLLTVGVAVILNKVDNSFSENVVMSILEYAVFLYTFGIVLWGIPYTLLALGLWLWSRSKDTQKIIRGFALSPLFLALLIAVETIIFIYGSANESPVISSDMWASLAALGLFSVVYGYLLIGITAGIYNILKRSNFIVNEDITLA